MCTCVFQSIPQKNEEDSKKSLKALRRTSDSKETVSDIALEFFKCSIFRSKSREKLINIVKDVLKHRARLPNGLHSDKFKFAPMVWYIFKKESGDKAREVLKEGYRLTEDPFVAQQLARLHIELKQLDQAFEVIKSATEQLPDNSYLWDTYGRIYEKQLSSEYEAYKNGLKRLTLDQMTEVVDLGFNGIEMFQKGQSASDREKTANDAGYYGELEIICTLLDCLTCCDAFQNDLEKDLKNLLVHESFLPSHLSFLKNVRGCDYVRLLKGLKPRVDTVLKRLEDEKLELKLSVKYLQLLPDTLFVKLKERLNYYFGEDPDQLPQDMQETDKCLYRRRQIFRLAGNNMNSIFELRWKDGDEGEYALMKVRYFIKKNIRSDVVSAVDYLIAISTSLALTSINPEWNEKIKFKKMLEWSTKLYETRQNLTIHSNTKLIYLEPYLFMTMFNWPRENTSQTFMPSEVEYAVSQWKDEFSKKYPRLDKEGKSHHKRETTVFFLANGSGMESIYTPKHDSKRVSDSEFWQQERTKKKLQRFEGILERGGTSLNYHFSGATLNIPTSLPNTDRSWWKKRVYFVIGFSWAGPKAYDVSLENPSSVRT